MARPKGVRSDLVSAFAFARWAAAQPKPPTWQQIQGVLQCSSDTARRWRRLWIRSIGADLPIPVGNRHH